MFLKHLEELEALLASLDSEPTFQTDAKRSFATLAMQKTHGATK